MGWVGRAKNHKQSLKQNLFYMFSPGREPWLTLGMGPGGDFSKKENNIKKSRIYIFWIYFVLYYLFCISVYFILLYIYICIFIHFIYYVFCIFCIVWSGVTRWDTSFVYTSQIENRTNFQNIFAHLAISVPHTPVSNLSWPSVLLFLGARQLYTLSISWGYI